jgi:hypothetical protein
MSHRAVASSLALAAMLTGSLSRADERLPKYALQFNETLQVLDLANVSFHKRIESAGRYEEISAPGSVFAVSHPVAIGWIGIGLHFNPIDDGHIGLTAWGMASPFFGQGLPSDAKTYDAMGSPNTPGFTFFGTIGPEWQTRLDDHLLVRASVGLGERYILMGGVSASSFIVQPRIGLELCESRCDGLYGVFIAADGGATGRTIILGADLGPGL